MGPQCDQISGVGNPTWVEKDGVGDRKDGDIGSDAQRQGENRDQRKPRRLGQLTYRVP